MVWSGSSPSKTVHNHYLPCPWDERSQFRSSTTNGPMRYSRNELFLAFQNPFLSVVDVNPEEIIYFFYFRINHSIQWSDLVRSFLNRTGSSLIAEYTNSAHFDNKCRLSAQRKNSSYWGQLSWDNLLKFIFGFWFSALRK